MRYYSLPRPQAVLYLFSPSREKRGNRCWELGCIFPYLVIKFCNLFGRTQIRTFKGLRLKFETEIV